MLALNDLPQSIHANAWLVTMIVGTVLPLLVGVVTKGSNKYKGLLLVVLNGVSAAIVAAEVPDGGAVWTAQTAIAAAMGIVVSVVIYKELYLKVGLTNDVESSKAHGNGKALLGPNTGI